jgi:hypothetical protein
LQRLEGVVSEGGFEDEFRGVGHIL